MSRLISVSIVPKNDADEPVTLSEAKEWFRIEDEYDEEDSVIKNIIKSSRQKVERYIGMCFVESEVEATYAQGYGKGNRSNVIEIMYGPVSSGDMDSLGLEGTREKPRLITNKQYVDLSYTSKWDDGLMLPDWAKEGILMEALFNYENRGDNLEYKRELFDQTIDFLYPFRQTLHEFLL